MIQIMLEVSTTRLSKTLISHRHSRFHFQKRILLTQLREIRSEIGSLKQTWTVQLDKLFQQEDVSTAELRFTNAPFHAIVAMPNGSHVLSQVSHSSRQTQSLARSATRELSENIGMTTFKLLCTVLGVRACRRNTDIIIN